MSVVTLETVSDEVKAIRRMMAKIMDRMENNNSTIKGVTASVFAKEFGPTKNPNGAPLNHEQLRYIRKKHPSVYNSNNKRYSIEAYKKTLNV